ncbi:adenylate/guanylate cyclase domain-containing protein [Tistlia consotensis]|uniref:adenylate/guanylate cyclase domain-containing protein n=1 Tax=Tistlia consotensis TaxID=1321365 RepID=UPI0013562F2A|nr:adenylate/guanylate cyclase domain-containing protein [Tistlia consotensis]
MAIVFTDVVDSTALGFRLGDERMDDVRRAHFGRSESLIADFGGRQVKTIGDSVMAVFRSAGDAFDFACTLHRNPGAAELRAKGIRAGIHSGEVDVVESDVFGTEVNFAARVTHAAEGAEIWLSGRAREAIDRAGARHRQGLNWRHHERIDLKGLGKYSLWSFVPDATAAPAALVPSRRSEQAAVVAPSPDLRSEPERRKVASPDVTPNGRTVFVARPASDMGQGYVRIVEELKGRGYAVVPDGDIPNDESAVAFIDAALAKAELSVHLLGDRPGITPDAPDMMAIGQLQLVRAALRSEQAQEDGTGTPQFRRIIWAPRFLEGAATPQAAAPVERNPIAVLQRFAEQLPTDRVLGENLIQFINYLHQHLDKTRPRTLAPQCDIGSGEKIFIDHAAEDYEYATELAYVLQQLSFEPTFAAPLDENEDRRKVEAFNRNEVLSCSAVAYCWGNASELWLRTRHSKIDSWRSRAKRDRIELTLIEAPPTHRAKKRFLIVKLAGIDRVVDMTNVDRPSPADLAEWLRPQTEGMGGQAGGG